MTTSEGTLARPHAGRIGILSGSGRLPILVAEALVATGQTPFVVNLTDQKPQWLSGFDHAHVPVTQLSLLVQTLRSAGVSVVTLAGGMSIRPRFIDFLTDWRMYGEFVRLFRALRRGDDGLLRAAVDFLERKGFIVVGVQNIAPQLLASNGVMTLVQPLPEDMPDIRLAMNAAIELGRADRGQAVVVREGAVIARETRDGTAAMLQRLNNHSFPSKSGVLVKWSKPGQELRVDLPSIGPDTVTQAVAAGLAGIVVESGHSLILDKSEVIRLANANGIFISGQGNQP